MMCPPRHSPKRAVTPSLPTPYDTHGPCAEIVKLRRCSTAAEVRTQLGRVLSAMESASESEKLRHEIGLSRPLFDAAIPENAKATVWTRENRCFLMSVILTFFDGLGLLSILPRDLTCAAVFCYLEVSTLATLCSTSRQVREISESDATWRAAHERRFPTTKKNGIVKYDFGASLKESYRQRIRDPTVGDRVEVAWQGRFRLEGLEVYRGLAWWAAEVAEKCDPEPEEGATPTRGVPLSPSSTRSVASISESEKRRYKVHYLDWDSRWDEWVSREELRWPVDEGKSCTIESGDEVEVWCSGNTVPGAWLRAIIDKIDNDLYCVCNVASSGRLWVKRERLRLVHRSRDMASTKRQRYTKWVLQSLSKKFVLWNNTEGALPRIIRNCLKCRFRPSTTRQPTAPATG